MKKQELIDMLLSITDETKVTVCVKTPVVLVSGNPYDKGVYQIQELTGNIGFDYLKKLNEEEIKSGVTSPSTEIKPRTWGKLSKNRVLVFNTNKGDTEETTYLHIWVIDKNKANTTYYTKQGDIIDPNDIKVWIRQNKRSSTQSQLPDGVEIVVRTIKLDNILWIKLYDSLYLMDAQ